jgi:geranylgeranyl pyrophosphate synthase
MVLDVILQEIQWGVENSNITWDQIHIRDIENIYIGKTSVIINVGIQWIANIFKSDLELIKQIQGLVSSLGIFLQRVNDLEDFSNTLANGQPNVDQFSDIRRRRITLIHVSKMINESTDLMQLRENAYAPNAQPPVINKYVKALLERGIINSEIDNLKSMKDALCQEIMLHTDLSSGTKIQMIFVLNKYVSLLDQLMFL